MMDRERAEALRSLRRWLSEPKLHWEIAAEIIAGMVPEEERDEGIGHTPLPDCKLPTTSNGEDFDLIEDYRRAIRSEVKDAVNQRHMKRYATPMEWITWALDEGFSIEWLAAARKYRTIRNLVTQSDEAQSTQRQLDVLNEIDRVVKNDVKNRGVTSVHPAVSALQSSNATKGHANSAKARWKEMAQAAWRERGASYKSRTAFAEEIIDDRKWEVDVRTIVKWTSEKEMSSLPAKCEQSAGKGIQLEVTSS